MRTLRHNAKEFGRILLMMAALLFAPWAQGQAAVAAPPEQKTIVVLGDSLAAGLGVEPEQAFPALLQKKIDAAGWPYTVVNAGVSGDTSADGLARLDWLLRRKIEVLILELGGNDGLRGLPVSATRTNLQAILDRVRQKFPQVNLIVAGMQMPPNMGEEYDSAFRAMYPALAAKNHAALVPFLLAGVGGRRELNQEDRIHPNAAGHALVAENVWKILQPILQNQVSQASRP
jgi:acyl-CoA thioesterase-1